MTKPALTAGARRALATRHAPWAIVLAHRLAGLGISPNAVSMASVAFAFAGSIAFAVVPDVAHGDRAALLLVAAASAQLRLLCNLIDGMLAVEEGLSSATGELYNDIPDRLADILLLVGAGYAVRDLTLGVSLGWIAATLALGTAYVRLLGGALQVPQPFCGPMAKQHRMFTLTVVTLLAAAECVTGMPPRAIRLGLGVIVAGAVVTIIRRIGRIVRDLEAR